MARTSTKKPCKFCGRMLHPKGVYWHSRSCKQNPRNSHAVLKGPREDEDLKTMSTIVMLFSKLSEPGKSYIKSSL